MSELWEDAAVGDEIGAVLIDVEENPQITASDIASLRRHYPLAKIVLMSDPAHCRRVMRVGREADGLIFRTYGADVIVKSLELILLGERIFPVDAWQPIAEVPSLAQAPSLAEVPSLPQAPSLAEVPPCARNNRPVPISPPRERRPDIIERLSEREVEVVRLLCKGDPNKIIARQLGISEATVKVHVKAILRKTQAKNRTEAALLMSAMARSSPH